MATRQKQTFDDRVAQYVDSPLVAQRVHYGKLVAARIHGNFGVYKTEAAKAKNISGNCNCPSEIWPCKHIHALRATWEENPASFFDVDHWLKGLTHQSKARLIEMIAEMVRQSPDVLGLFEVPGFEDEQEDDEDFYA